MHRLTDDKSPIRTCISCRRKAVKMEFFRLTVRDYEVIFDEKYRLPGRGAYSCKQKMCLQKIYKNKKKIAVALRMKEVKWHSDILKFIKL